MDDVLPGPWTFHEVGAGFRHVVFDRDGRYICSSISVGTGRLIAAAPTMRDALRRIAEGPPSEAQRIAQGAIESVAERDAIVAFG